MQNTFVYLEPLLPLELEGCMFYLGCSHFSKLEKMSGCHQVVFIKQSVNDMTGIVGEGCEV